jgi:hypothetical protein
MFDKPETLAILKKMVIIAAIGLLILPIIDLIIAEANLGLEAIAALNAIKNPVAYFIALFLWFQLIILILKSYWEKDELATSITTSSFVIIIGTTIQQLNLDTFSTINNSIASASSLVSSIGTLILLFGFVILFYNIIKYIWVKI